MIVSGVADTQHGKVVLLSGNEALARGGLEAGVGYAASYPGSPTAEVLGILGKLAKQFEFYAEWSVNEKVALEGAAAASFAGLRSMAIMKPDGLNVAVDFLTSLSLSGISGGLVVVVGDDPSGHSSLKEEDSRYLAKLAHLPVLEPATVAEARDMVREAFNISEAITQPVVVRCVTRVCHASGNVTLGEIKKRQAVPSFPEGRTFDTLPAKHRQQEEKLRVISSMGETFPFNCYEGPERADTIIISCGPSFLYCREALSMLNLSNRVGLLKLGLTWPLPEKTVLDRLVWARSIIIAEEIEPFLEENLAALVARYPERINRQPSFYGKISGHVEGTLGPGLGELNVDAIIAALKKIPGLTNTGDTDPDPQNHFTVGLQPLERELTFCPGCPHRPSLWAIRAALELDGRQGVVTGDIGCYTLGRARAGYHLLRTVHCMGAGAGVASGLSKLNMLGFNQPVVAIMGDSTFFHSAVPALINARFNQSNFLAVVLDNETTAMTGHQPHPGLGINAMGENTTRVDIEKLATGLGIPVTIHDPYDVKGTVRVVLDLIHDNSLHLLILRRACALAASRKTLSKPKVYVDQDRCQGDSCGCQRFCARVLSCPAIIWDSAQNRAFIDQSLCTGCGVCASLCPQQAIVVERGEEA